MYWIAASPSRDGSYVLVSTLAHDISPLLVFEGEEEARRYLQILNGDAPSTLSSLEGKGEGKGEGETTARIKYEPKVYRSSTHVIMLTSECNTVAVRRCSVRSHLKLGHIFSAKKVDVHCPRRGVVVRVARATAKTLIVSHRFEWGGRAELIRVSLSDINLT